MTDPTDDLRSAVARLAWLVYDLGKNADNDVVALDAQRLGERLRRTTPAPDLEVKPPAPDLRSAVALLARIVGDLANNADDDGARDYVGSRALTLASELDRAAAEPPAPDDPEPEMTPEQWGFVRFSAEENGTRWARWMLWARRRLHDV